ncbi:MAG: IS110 family transposase [Bryobacteraceae bacterium]
MRQPDRTVFEPNAAGIDIGAREIFVAVPPDRDEHPVRQCETFTGDLHKMAEWLVRCGITTVAMESTGVYWIPVYDVLEQHGIKPCLVNPRNMKNVPGKRTDFHECQWIQHLHSLGLLHSAFRPDGEVCAVRSIMRHRNDMVEMASQHILHMQKALTQMNVQFQHVISDLTGLTGMLILDAIVAGERDPAVLAKSRDPRVKADEETIRKSLEGTWRPEHILALKQRLSLYRSHRDLIDDCDKEIEKLVASFEPRVDPDEKPMPEDRKQKQRKRKKKSGDPDFNMRAEAYKLFGVDLTQIPGLMTLVFMLFSEVGRDMSRWPTAAHFVSWLGLCPDNDISGGKVLWRGARRTKNRAGTLFRLAAHSLHRDQTPIGHYLRRMKAKLGPAAATTATAHKIAIIFYTMVSKQVEYDASLWAQRDQLREKRIEARLHNQAAQRGYRLVPLEPAA